MPLRRSRPAPPLAPLLCRWDLDKTYLRTEFDTLRQLLRTARERGADKVEVPGVPALMKAMRQAADAQGRELRVFFISASPPQIGEAIREKLSLDGVPYDGITFKDQLKHIRSGKLRNLREHVGYKLGELFRGRIAAPEGGVDLLFGDDWESDALSYSLYADVIAGRVDDERLARVMARIGVDPLVVPEVCALGRAARGRAEVERIFINLERRTPPAAFRIYGPRLVPAFNYFQTAVVLAASGYVTPDGVADVATALCERAGFTPRRLANTLADVVRRGLVPAEIAEAVVEPLRTAALLPARTTAGAGWLRRLVGRWRGRRAVAPATTLPMALDYDAILEQRDEAHRGAGAASA